MTTNIFKKAKTQYYQGLINYEGNGIKNEYYQIKDNESQKTHTTTLTKNQNGTTITCTCTQQSLPRKQNLEQGKQPLCSHIITTIIYKIGKTPLPK